MIIRPTINAASFEDAVLRDMIMSDEVCLGKLRAMLDDHRTSAEVKTLIINRIMSAVLMFTREQLKEAAHIMPSVFTLGEMYAQQQEQERQEAEKFIKQL